MTTLADSIKTEMTSATLDDLLKMDERIVATETMLRSLKAERSRLFMEVQRQRIMKERLAAPAKAG